MPTYFYCHDILFVQKSVGRTVVDEVERLVAVFSGAVLSGVVAEDLQHLVFDDDGDVDWIRDGRGHLALQGDAGSGQQVF